MERSFEAGELWGARGGYRDIGAPAAAAQEWNGLGSGRPFVVPVEEVLREAREPDPQFFVESWTVGLIAATENFLRRRQNREQGAAPAYRALDSFGPFYSAEECVYGQKRPGEAEVAAMPAAAPMGKYGLSWPTAGGAIDARCEQNSELRWRVDVGGEFEGAASGQATSGQATSGPLTLAGACRLLGVAASSTREQIKAGYRRMAGRYHPDRLEGRSEQERHLATERMVSINEAYHLLCGTQMRESA